MILDKSSRGSSTSTATGVRRVRNRAATIEVVLDAAQRLFSSRGFDRTSLVDIASETGLSPRGVILHFSSKADIAAELMLRDLRTRAATFRPNGEAQTSCARILAFFAWLADGDRRSFINFPALWAFSARWSPKVEATTQQACDQLLEPVRQAIADGIVAGELRRVDPDVARDTLWVNYLSGLRRAAIQGGKPADALPYVERALSLLQA